MAKNGYSIVEVAWIDACTETIDHLPLKAAENAQPILRSNVGYLVGETEDCLVLTFGLISDDNCDMLFTLPKKMIIGEPQVLKWRDK